MHIDIKETDQAHIKGLRSVAAVEIVKGVLVLAGTIAFVVLLHRDVDLQSVALRVLDFLHIDPERHIATLFLNAAERAMYLNVAVVIGFASIYVALRFIEGYGLWRGRVWAEWMALISGAIYLPLEIRELLKGSTLLRWSLLITNLLILAYIAYVRFGDRKARELVSAD